MATSKLLSASTRVALSAYLHDLGKFAERAAIEEAQQKDKEGNTAKAIHVQEYCPHFNNRPSHIHAAYTAIAMDVIEESLPDIKAGDCQPFDSWQNRSALKDGDSMINAAARHHRPETFLQWIIATADRLASGFERNEFDDYNRAEEGGKKKNYKQTRQFVLFENIDLSDRQQSQDSYRYPLKALSPNSIFPDLAEKVEPDNDKQATNEYQQLWQQFLGALKKEDGSSSIPKKHRLSLPLWFDHFDTLWQTFTHCIPSATAGRLNGKFIAIPADVSLYDHSRTTAALATALWRFHDELNRTSAESILELREKDAKSSNPEQKFLLVQGDMFGIQNFIFTNGGNTQKYAAKLLRGRSLYVSLLAECAALKILDALSLPPCSQVTNAAGKFLIVAPNTEATQTALEKIKKELDQWFLTHSQGRAGIGLAIEPASSQDFAHGKKEKSPFRALMQRLFESLERAKLQRLNLCGVAPTIFTDFLDRFDKKLGVCELDGLSPAIEKNIDNILVGQLSKDQMNIGKWLANRQMNRILISRNVLEKQNNHLHTPIFGLHVTFTETEEISGKFGSLAEQGELIRAWDISLPSSDPDQSLWNGYARRNINSYAPVFDKTDDLISEKYKQWESELDKGDFKGFTLKTLNHIACENRTMPNPDKPNEWEGVAALNALKGDVDNLGHIFQQGMEQPSFARMSALSRQMNNFFAVYLPYFCQKHYRDTYTVFAGGDDFYMIGPWRSQTKLAVAMRKEFSRYVANNPDIHFSAGFHMSKPGVPIRYLGEAVEKALDLSKEYETPTQNKNAVTCYGQTMTWDDFENVLEESEMLRDLRNDYHLSTALIYSLLKLSEKAGAEKSKHAKPEDSLWRSQISYRVARFIGDNLKRKKDESIEAFQLRHTRSVNEVRVKLTKAIEYYRMGYHVALFDHLYQYRD
jgi:CRISPR-associated protein Csm1